MMYNHDVKIFHIAIGSGNGSLLLP